MSLPGAVAGDADPRDGLRIERAPTANVRPPRNPARSLKRVGVGPGQSADTVTPRPDSSSARARVSETTKAFDA